MIKYLIFFLPFTLSATTYSDITIQKVRDLVDYHSKECAYHNIQVDYHESKVNYHANHYDYYVQILEYLEKGWEIK